MSNLPMPVGPSPGAKRTRDWRIRRREQRRVYRIEADEVEVEDLLCATGQLAREKLDDPREVEKALGRVFMKWLAAAVAKL